MMKKTIFLFLLFLMIYGAVNVEAQVRIGSDSAPHPSAILDLNPNVGDEARGGVLLPRVRLESETHKVFGPNITIAEGLMVYNLNEERDYDRPAEGVYCYNGTEWIPTSSNDEVKFTIIYNGPKQLWLGVNGELEIILGKNEDELNVIWDPAVDNENEISYEWTLSARDYPSITIKTLQPTLSLASLPSLQHTAYNVVLTAKYHWTKKKHAIATVAVGPGAWIGEQRWLKVANTNLGALEDIPIEKQLQMTYGTDVEMSDSLGYLFQWASTHFRTERKYDLSKQFLVMADMINPNNGQINDGATSQDFFLLGTNNGDWRYYFGASSSMYPPDKWIWNLNNAPDGTQDPCRSIKGGRWRVPTEKDWNNIENCSDNRITSQGGSSIYRGGIKVSVSGVNSFFLPATKTLSPEDGHLFPNPTGKKLGLGYWLNDNGSKDFVARAIGESGEGGEISEWSGSIGVANVLKASGLNIRCVADY